MWSNGNSFGAGPVSCPADDRQLATMAGLLRRQVPGAAWR